jgi:hypothetical protein
VVITHDDGEINDALEPMYVPRASGVEVAGMTCADIAVPSCS